MRLKQNEIQNIKSIIYLFDIEAKIILFGSRVDDSKRGGDIDLLICSNVIDFKSLLNIRVKLIETLGEQKIDIILAGETDEIFRNHVIKTGVEL